jgi:hypothetical protein
MPYQPAVLGTARLNNFRLNSLSAALRTIRGTRIRVFLDGELATHRIRRAGFTIHDVLNDAPNTCALTIEGTPPPESGMALRITINSDTPRLLFNGTLQTDGQTYEGRPTQLAYPCQAIDDTARLNYRRPFGIWVATSATTVAQQLVAQFAPGFSTAGIALGLPLVTVSFDGSEGFSGCLRQIAKLIGGYFYVDDLVVHLFLEEATETPDPITGPPTLMQDDPPIVATSDDSQLRTRVYGRGLGETVRVDLSAGATVIPIEDAAFFNPPGGLAILSTTPDGSPTEIVAYTGLHLGGGGVIVGPGAAPSVALEAAIVPGAGLGAGGYQYAYTFVTASGESLPSPLASLNTSASVADPTVAPTAWNWQNGGYLNSGTPIGEAQEFVYTYSTIAGFSDYSQQTLPSPPVANTTVSNLDALNPTRSAPVRITVPNSTDPRVKSIYIYVKSAQSGGVIYRGAAAVANNTAGGFTSVDTTGTTSTSQPAPTSNTSAAGKQVALTGVAIGGAATTARKIYRTIANGSILKLQQTIANNTATVGITDATPDGSLGATAPSTDTSGLTQPFGQVNAGSTSIPVTGTGPFPSSGYVETSAGELVRYTGLSAQTVTGIPTSGPGSIQTTVLYGSPLVPVPALAGVSGLTKAVQAGSRVHVWVQRDDLAAQGEAATRESTDTYASDGIHEHLIIDERRGDTSLAALCDADLALFARPIVTVVYASRDVKTKSGKPIAISLASPAIDETLTIQDVTITEVDVAPGTPPRFTVTASSVRFSLEDTLRRLSGLLET